MFLRALTRCALTAAPAVAACGGLVARNDDVKAREGKKKCVVDGAQEFTTIIVGGGTAGCTCAYLLAKWMEDHNVPGNVLLLDRGVSFSPQAAPSPRLERWYENWCEFGEAHEAINIDGSAYPVVPSDHRGLGGCSTHDTRITFQLREEQKKRIAEEMGWSVEQLNVFLQTSLNFMPLSAAIDKHEPIAFYDAVISSLTNNNNYNNSFNASPPLKRLPDDEHKSEIVIDSIAASSLAMYQTSKGNDELRWTPSYFTLECIRPSKLKIVTNAVADKLEFANNELRATGVSFKIGDESFVAHLEEGGGQIAVTSGAIGSVAILQRSGIGPADHLQKLSIPVVIDNPFVGHGIDHEEIAMLYEWLDEWNTKEGEVPRGGAMGWPLVLFASFRPELEELYSQENDKKEQAKAEETRGGRSSYFQSLFGAGYAEPYTSFPSVMATPNCLRPDLSEQGGYRVLIRSTDPEDTCLLIQGDHRRDLETIAQGVFAMAPLFSILEKDGVVGKQLEPPFPISVEDSERIIEKFKENHYPVFHWSSTCQAGRNGRVADEHFRLRIPSSTSSPGVVSNLFVGSAASLPEVSEANPHLTISAFSVALAESLARSTMQQRASSSSSRTTQPIPEMQECVKARQDLRSTGGRIAIRREGEERPKMKNLAVSFNAAWEKAHSSVPSSPPLPSSLVSK